MPRISVRSSPATEERGSEVGTTRKTGGRGGADGRISGPISRSRSIQTTATTPAPIPMRTPAIFEVLRTSRFYGSRGHRTGGGSET